MYIYIYTHTRIHMYVCMLLLRVIVHCRMISWLRCILCVFKLRGLHADGEGEEVIIIIIVYDH